MTPSQASESADTPIRSIEELIALARAGDPAAMDELFLRCRKFLEIGAAAQVETWAQAKFDASDVVQQTMLHAFRSFRHFEGNTTGEWLAWLKQIMAHHSADLVRKYRISAKRQVRREVPIRHAGDDSRVGTVPEPPAANSSPSQQLVRKETQLQVAEALAGLSEDHREVIVLRNLQKLSFEEVARRMGRTRPATQMLWMRAIKNLQAAMMSTP